MNFHHTLSERSVYLRYFHWMKLEQRTEHERLTRMCFIDYDRQMAFVAERDDPAARRAPDCRGGQAGEIAYRRTRPNWP